MQNWKNNKQMKILDGKSSPAVKKSVFRTQVWNSLFSDEVKAAATTTDNFHPSPLKSLVDLTMYPRQVIEQDLCDTAVWLLLTSASMLHQSSCKDVPYTLLAKGTDWKLHWGICLIADLIQKYPLQTC